MHATRCEISFHPNDRFYPRTFGRSIEIYDTVHRAMVGESDGWHAKLHRPIDQRRDATEAI